MTSDDLLRVLRDRYELDGCGDNTWYLSDIAEDVDKTPDEVQELLKSLEDTGKVSVHKTEKVDGVSDFFVVLTPPKLDWD